MSEQQPVTIVVIGPTQHGKSTFINYARGMSLEQSTAVREGTGGGDSCTVECETKSFLIPMTTYKLRDPVSGRDIPIPDDEEELFSSVWRKTRYEIVPVDAHRPPVRLRVIDTPGLDDSKGRDAEHIQKVLRTVAAEPYITAIAFVCNFNLPFSKGFQENYDHYSRCMPNLMAPGALAVINTNFSVTTWEQKHQRIMDERSRKSGRPQLQRESASSRVAAAVAAHAPSMPGLSKPKSTKEIVIEERKKDFKKKFEKAPAHFFIDSKPSRNSPFENMVSMNNFVEIMDFLCNKGSMPTGQMKLIKSIDMFAVDDALAQLLFAAKTNWLTEQELEQRRAQEKGDREITARSNIQKKVERAKNDLETMKKELDRLDNETEYPLAPDIKTTDDISTVNRFWMGVTARKFKGVKVITETTVSKFFVEATNKDPNNSRWTNTSGTDAVTRTWRGEYLADWAQVPKLSARTYTWNKYWYTGKIGDLQAQITRTAAELEQDKKDLEFIERNDPNSGTTESKRIRLLNKLVAEVDKLVQELQAESVPLDAGFNDTAQRRYRKQPTEINERDLWELVQEDNPELAAAWTGVGPYPLEHDEKI